jgi:hypothetical protein
MFIRVCLIVLLIAGRLWSQVESGAAPAAEDPMATPSPVNVEGPSLAFVAEEERTNYVRGGVSFSPAYDDGLAGATVSDVSYSVRPWVEIDESKARLHWSLSYSPGFTFYQRNTSLNQSDHDLAADFRYRLSPHITLTFRNDLTKSSISSFRFDPNQIGSETGIPQGPNQSVISPNADVISNIVVGQITYQFSENGLVGASGLETVQHYLHPSQVPGFFDWSTRGGTGFYTYRLSRKHYLGATYQFEQLLSDVPPKGAETQTHSVFLFYTLYPGPGFSVSFFGGSQHFEVAGLGIPNTLGWSPAGGAVLGWQGHYTSANLRFDHRVTDGSGLQSSALSDSASLSVRHQLNKTLTVALGGGYANNRLVDPLLPGSAGHTVTGSLSLQRTFGEHFSAELGYARAHQSYPEIPSISNNPDRNRGWVAFSYNFQRPLGR